LTTPARSEAMTNSLRLVAPGQPLREGLDRILQARMGALVVVGDGPEVLAICSGGFLLDAEFTPQRLSELAKMDGAIILSADASRIARANVHLVPDPNTPTTETGTRHRTAERVGRQVDVPTITVSEDMSVVAMHRRGEKRQLEPVSRVLARADQAMQILERYRVRLDAVTTGLSATEIEDLVTWRDVATSMQRAEMVRRISEEIEGYINELGTDGRLVMLQLEELTSGVDDEYRLLISDYRSSSAPNASEILVALGALESESLLDVEDVVRTLGYSDEQEMEGGVRPRGLRLLARIPRLPASVSDQVVAQFGSLARIMRASLDELIEVDGVGEVRARVIKDGIARIVESSILERYK